MHSVTESLREKCPNTEFLWSVFSYICTEYGVFGVSLRLQSECGKIRTKKNSVSEHFSRSEYEWGYKEGDKMTSIKCSCSIKRSAFLKACTLLKRVSSTGVFR